MKIRKDVIIRGRGWHFCAISALTLALSISVARADTVTAEPDAFLDYIEATGSQYIDTGVNAETGLKARIDMEWGDGGTSCDWGFLGAKDNTLSSESKKRLFLYHGNYYSGMFRVAYGYGDFGRPAHSPGYNKRHEIVSDFTDNSAIQIQLNGTNTIQAADQSTRAGARSGDRRRGALGQGYGNLLPQQRQVHARRRRR